MSLASLTAGYPLGTLPLGDSESRPEDSSDRSIPASRGTPLKATGVLAMSALLDLRRVFRSRLRVRDERDDDLPTLRSLIDYLKEEESKKRRDYRLGPNTPEYIVVTVEALDNALDMIGRTGKEVLYAMLEERYELRPTDIALKPGQFMSALRHLLGNSALVIETFMLYNIDEKTRVRGWSLEDAVYKLKAAYQKRGSQRGP
jgi:hypothetical protein